MYDKYIWLYIAHAYKQDSVISPQHESLHAFWKRIANEV
jgi:hypothetical protein